MYKQSTMGKNVVIQILKKCCYPILSFHVNIQPSAQSINSCEVSRLPHRKMFVVRLRSCSLKLIYSIAYQRQSISCNYQASSGQGRGEGTGGTFPFPYLTPKHLLFFPHCFPIILILTIMGFTLLKPDCTDLVTNNNQHIFFCDGDTTTPITFSIDIRMCNLMCSHCFIFFSLS